MPRAVANINYVRARIIKTVITDGTVTLSATYVVGYKNPHTSAITIYNPNGDVSDQIAQGNSITLTSPSSSSVGDAISALQAALRVQEGLVVGDTVEIG